MVGEKVVNKESGEMIGSKLREKDTLTGEFWNPIFADTDFKDFVKNQYSIGLTSKVDMEEIVSE